MPDILDIRLGDVAELDLTFESAHSDQTGPSLRPGLATAIVGSLAFHGALGAALLFFGIDNYRPSTAPPDTVQMRLFVSSTLIQEQSVSALLESALPAEPIEPSGSDDLASAQSIASVPAESDSSSETNPESALRSEPQTSSQSVEVELPAVAEFQPSVPADSGMAEVPSTTPAPESPLPSVVSIRNVIQNMEAEYGPDTWSKDCNRTAFSNGRSGNQRYGATPERMEFEECAQVNDRDFSAAGSKPVYDSLNQVGEVVTRSRRTAPLVARQRNAVTTRLQNSDIPQELRDLPISEMNRGVNTYYGNHRRAVERLQILMRKDPAFTAAQQLFDPAIMHWLQFREMENR